MVEQHIASAFDRDLEAIQARIMKMGGLVEAAILDAAQSLETRDEELAEQVRAGDKAIDFSTEKHLAREKELAESFKSKGLNIYEPDVAAFRKHVQDKYLASEQAKAWPAGMVDKINAL